jgi:hypothetical protein
VRREEVSHGIVRVAGERNLKSSPAKEAVPAKDFIAAERNLTEVGVLARPLAELVAPPTVGHHAEPSAAMIANLMIADLGMLHHALAQQFKGISLR